MRRFLLFTLVIGLFAVQADAALWNLDAPTARTFLQLSADGSGSNQLELVIDSPGTQPGSTVHFLELGNIEYGIPASYPTTMQYNVGFAGDTSEFAPGQPLVIGAASTGQLLAGDTFQIAIANDNDDLYEYTAWYSTGAPLFTAASISQGTPVTLNPDTKGTVSVIVGGTAPTYFGFTLDYVGTKGGDQFRTSVVPVPGAILLGMLGLSVAGIKLRKHA